MLICKKCSAECSDTAKFCHICGERIDGKKRCDACGAWNEQDAIFCPSCGARVDGKTVCSDCGTLFEGNFCPECGKAVKQAKTANFQAEKTQKPRGTVGEKVKSISELVSGACIALGALFALIFVFFIGVKPSAVGLASSIFDSLAGGERLDLYYFFGQVYEDVKELQPTAELGTPERWIQHAAYLRFQEYATVGTIVSAVILLVVACTAITALTLYVLNWLKITKKSSYGWGMAAIISFIGGVVLFANISSLSISALDSTQAISLIWRNATTAGFVLCAVFGGLAIVAKMLAQGSAPWKRDRILKTVLSFVGMAIVCAWLCAASGLNMCMKESTSDISVHMSFTLFNILLLAFVSVSDIQSATTELRTRICTVTTLNVISQIIVIVLIAYVVIALITQTNNLHKKQRGSTLGLSIIAWILSLALCIICAISISTIAVCAEYATNSSVFATDTIEYVGYNVAFTMVMSSVYLVYEIGKKVLKSLSKAKENA